MPPVHRRSFKEGRSAVRGRRSSPQASSSPTYRYAVRARTSQALSPCGIDNYRFPQRPPSGGVEWRNGS